MLGLGNILTKGGAVLGFPNKYSFNFDGSNDYLETADNESFDFGTGDFSISFWFNVNDIDWNWAVSRVNSANSNDVFRAGTNNSGKIIFRDIAGGTDIVGSTTVSINTWYHFQAVRNSGTLKLYLNGSEDASGSSGGNFNSDKGFRVGRWQGSGDYFDGLIDEVAIWDTALSADDVAKIASKPVDFSKASTYATDRTSNLKLWLRAGDKAEPESTTAIARQDFYTDFDGTDDYVQTADLTFTTALSVSAWVNHSSISGDQTYVADWDYPNNGRSFQFRWNDDTTDKLEFMVTGDGSTQKTNSANFTPDINRWYHLVATYNAGTTKIYINGVSQTVTADASQPTSLHSSSDVVLIGATGDTSTRVNYMNGGISSVSLYQTVLDAQTISQMAKSRFTPQRDLRFSVVDFDGTNDYIDTNDSNLLITGTNVTLSAWIRTTDSDEAYIIQNQKAPNSSNLALAVNFDVSGESAGKLSAIIWGGSSHSYVTYDASINDSSWHYIALTTTSSAQVLYLDGVAVATGSNTFSNSASSDHTMIGTQGEGQSKFFGGSLSSVAIYNDAKDAEFVYAQYQKGITHNPSADTGLVGLWRMGDDTSAVYPTIADSSSNSNDGTITNGSIDDIVQQMVAGYDLGAFESSSEELGGDFARAVTADNWTAYANMTVNTITDGVSIVAPTTASGLSVSSNGAFIHFRGGTFLGENQLTTKDLEVGKIYSVTFNAFYSGGASGVYADIYNSSESVFSDEFTTTNTSYTMVFEAKNATTGLLRFQQIKLDNTVYITNITVKEVLQSEVSDTYPAIIDVNEPVLGVETFPDSNSVYTVNDYYQKDSSNPPNLTYLDTDTGTVTINDSDLEESINISATYKLTFTISGLTSGQANFKAVSTNFGNTYVDETMLDNGTHTFYFTRPAGGGSGILFRSDDASGSTFTISDYSLKRVLGNVGTMTNQDSADLVYSSVLPDQSFLGTGVNSAYNFISLDGSNEYIDAGTGIGNFLGDNYAGDLSISVWFKSAGFGNDGVFNIGNFSSTNGEILILIYNNELGFHLNNAGWRVKVTSFSDTSWNHLVCVYKSGSESDTNMYLNGSSVGSKSGTFPSASDIDLNGLKTIIGAYSSASTPFNGDMGQVAIWNKELSSTEVSAIYTAGRHSNLLDSYSDNLKGYWAMSALDAKTGLSDVGDGTIYDRSGNSNHGTATNTESADLKSSPNAEPNGYAKGDTNRSTTTP